MEQEEKGIEKKEQEDDKKNEKSATGEEKMRKKSNQENVSKQNPSRFRIFERCSLDQKDVNTEDKKVDTCTFNNTVTLDTSKQCLPNLLESSNR